MNSLEYRTSRVMSGFCSCQCQLSNVICTLRPRIKPGGSIDLCFIVTFFAHLLFKSGTSVYGIPTPHRFNKVVASLLPVILCMVKLGAVPNGDRSGFTVFSQLCLSGEIFSASALFVIIT